MSTSDNFSASALPSSDPLRVAVVGAGPMGRHHVRAIQAVSGSRLVAVVDASEPAIEAVRALAPDVAAFPSVAAMLESGTVDVVHICTPPATHAVLATEVLRAGCHAYVEKPVAESRADVDRLIDLAQDSGVLLCAGHQLLREKPARELARLLPAIGSLVHAESYFAFRPVRRAGAGRRLMRADDQLLDILPHPVYLLLEMLERAIPGAETRMRSVEVGAGGTVHALLSRGSLTATLVVTLEGRPIENTLRLVGTGGTLVADFVRGSTVRQLGAGSSSIAKVLHPYTTAQQLTTGATSALLGRLANRQRSYPGLTALTQQFHHAIRSRASAPPLSYEGMRATVSVCEQIAERIARVAPTSVSAARVAAVGASSRPLAVVTGGTGFLGTRTVKWLRMLGADVRVLARREPAQWERLADVDYVVTDLAGSLDARVLRGAQVIVHCAAATSGGFEEHRLHSVDATRHVMQAAADAGVRRVIHVSSLGVVVQAGSGEPISERTPTAAPSRAFGPYVWGKAESERLARDLGSSLGIDVRIVRPGAIVDFERFDPPGRLGRRAGNTFVAVGRPDEKLGIVELDHAARSLAWMALHFKRAPKLLHLLSPVLPTRAELVERLRSTNPQLRVRWIGPILLPIVSVAARALQRTLRPNRTPIDVAKLFSAQSYDTAAISALSLEVDGGTRSVAPVEAAAGANVFSAPFPRARSQAVEVET